MSNSKRREIKGSEIRKLAEMCIDHLHSIDPHGFGICWVSDARKVNRIAEILGVPYRVSDRADTRIGPKLIKVDI